MENTFNIVAGQVQLWLSRPSWRNIKSTWQEVSNFPWHQPPQNDSIVCTGAAPGWEPRGACQNWGEYPPGTGTLQRATPKVSDFKPLWVVAMFSLLSPCWQKPLGGRDHSLVTLQPASLYLRWREGRKEEKLVIVTSRLLPPKMLLPKGCPSGGGCWGVWLCPLWGERIKLTLWKLGWVEAPTFEMLMGNVNTGLSLEPSPGFFTCGLHCPPRKVYGFMWEKSTLMWLLLF